MCSAAVVAAALTLTTACGSGDATVAKTPEPTDRPPAATSAPAAAAPAPGPKPTPKPADPCAVNLAAPAIAKAVSELPRDPRSGQGWNPEPLTGNYSECADLSAVIVKANTNAPNPSTRAVMFNRGKYVSQGVPDTLGFNGIDLGSSTGDTVTLTYSGAIPGLVSTVRFRWNGSGVELVSNTG
ncbi:LppP/LprE family lipoprotein [Mycobacterium sp. MYCO198283]|nr:LppP/LprE family lipoprotein [Mycobacterium sp. MYCO198283]MCG5430749.1 LppP/LprE family lipoprotein [Mycobacterium sp. MYCO198283]